MNKKTLRLPVASICGILLMLPAYGRGFGGGGFRGGGFDHGGFDRGGFENRSGGDRSARGDFPRSDYGGAGFDRISGRDNPEAVSAGNTYNHTTNVNNYHHANVADGYHGYGYHPYGAYGYHPYGYGYHGAIYGYPGGWCDAGFAEASMFSCMGLTSLYGFLGLEAMNNNNNSKQQLASTNVSYQGANIYVGGQPADQYYQQGQQLAALAPIAAGQTAEPIAAAPSQTSVKWQPLGVYALAQPGQSDSTMLFQLAINKDGIVRGNYLNKITNEKAQVHGALDKKDQRISWTVGNNPQTVFDSTLKELAKDHSKVVVQFGPDSAQQMALVRQKPPANENASTPQNPES